MYLCTEKKKGGGLFSQYSLLFRDPAYTRSSCTCTLMLKTKRTLAVAPPPPSTSNSSQVIVKTKPCSETTTTTGDSAFLRNIRVIWLIPICQTGYCRQFPVDANENQNRLQISRKFCSLHNSACSSNKRFRKRRLTFVEMFCPRFSFFLSRSKNT